MRKAWNYLHRIMSNVKTCTAVIFCVFYEFLWKVQIVSQSLLSAVKQLQVYVVWSKVLHNWCLSAKNQLINIH